MPGRPRAEHTLQALARRRRHAVAARLTMSKSKSSDAALVLRGVHDAEARLDAEQLQILDERPRVRLQRAGEIEELDLERLAVRQPQHVALALAAGLAQQARRPGAAALRSCPEPSETGGTIGLAEHLVRELAAERLQQRELLGRGLARRPSCRSSRSTRSCACTTPNMMFCVRPLEIEQQPDRLADARILELRRGAVLKYQPCVPDGRLVRDGLALDPALAHGREVVARSPSRAR